MDAVFAVRPQPGDSEQLGSYLLRLAHRNHLSLRQVLKATLPTRHLRARTNFLTLRDQEVDSFADRLDLTPQQVEGMLFWTESQTGGPSKADGSIPTRRDLGTNTGIAKLSSRRCPHCLAESREPAWPREWRLLWLMCCTTHKTLMEPFCPECESPWLHFHPQGNEKPGKPFVRQGAIPPPLDRCHGQKPNGTWCNREVRQAPRVAAPQPLVAATERFESDFKTALEAGATWVEAASTIWRRITSPWYLRAENLPDHAQEILFESGLKSSDSTSMSANHMKRIILQHELLEQQENQSKDLND